ncbi:MAG TPA: 30S ribosomal protein S1 [Candidatus Angelobacter sp.]
MPDPSTPEFQTAPDQEESFGSLLSQYEQRRSRKTEDGPKQLEGTVIAVTAESVVLDIGFKTEGVLPLSAFPKAGELEAIQPGDKVAVNIKGRDPQGYYELSRGKISRPRDWTALERAFAEHTTIAGTVMAVVKGGLSVDIGVRAFMPSSRSGVRDAADMEKLVGQDIRCRITKLDVTEEDVVVDSRIIAEEEQRAAQELRFAEIKEGETVSGVVRSLADYGAFIDIGGVDGLLHVGEISWGRVNKPADVLSVGQQVQTRVLKVDADKRRISLGMKQLQPHPWDSVEEKYRVGERVRGTITRVADFGAFVELEPGIEGLIHLSEMSWAKKARKPSDVVKPGETVEAVVLAVNPGERRLSLGLKQALGDPWIEVTQRFPVGAVIEGPVTSVTKFGAFVQLAEGVEGMIHVSDLSAEKRIDHPGNVLKVGQVVKAQVLEIDSERRRLKLGMKQMVPSGLDEYIAEHKPGDVVTGRVTELSSNSARVELGEGIHATCRITAEKSPAEAAKSEAKADISSLSSMLQARWKTGTAPSSAGKRQPPAVGQILTFRIASLDPAAKKIELELA